MKRVLLLPVAIAGALVAHWFGLTHFGISVLVGLGLPIVATLGGRSSISTPTPGYVCVWFGIALLIISLFICRKNGISFEELFHDRSFSRTVRRLPYYGITSVTAGLTIITLSIVRR